MEAETLIPFTGLIDLEIFFGLMYDSINIPYQTSQIVNEALKTISCKGYVEWQTTWLTSIIINLNQEGCEDYQDLVGAQYVRIYDAGSENHGYHWYTVAAYTQLTQKTALLSILYDPVLTLAPGVMDKVSGLIKRWTVDDDSNAYKYVKSSEPIDIVAPLSYTYYKYNPINTANDPHRIAGFAYDMTSLPEVATYTNPSGETTNIYYPKLSFLSNPTEFFVPYGTDQNYSFNDGLGYYVWNISSTAFKCYNMAVSLGMDIMSEGYLIPSTSLLSVNTTSSGTGMYTQMYGKSATFTPNNMSRSATGYNNAKTGVINRYYTLYNPFSGDSVTVANYELNSLTVTVSLNPHVSGHFLARFSSYLNDTTAGAHVGYVKSPGWQPLTITSSANYQSAANNISNIISTDYVNFTSGQQVGLYESQIRASNRVYDAQYNQNELNLLPSVNNAYKSGISILEQLQKIGKQGINSQWTGLQGVQDMALTAVNTGTGNDVLNAQRAQTNLEINNSIKQIELQRDLQLAQLSYEGTAGKLMPPTVKYAQSTSINSDSWSFVVQQAVPSAADLQRIDRFFTAYGYNVDGVQLTSASQLNCRQRFTFIQVDDFELITTRWGTDNTRLRDARTITELKNRYSAGLRIWKETPDYDYTKANPVTGG